MSSVMTFLAGLWLGGLIGVYTIALLQANRLEDDTYESDETTPKPH